MREIWSHRFNREVCQPDLLMRIEKGERVRLKMVTEPVTPRGIRFLRACRLNCVVSRPSGISSRNVADRLCTQMLKPDNLGSNSGVAA